MADKKYVVIEMALLRKLEYITDEFTRAAGGRCLICGGYRRDRDLHPGEWQGHTEACELGKALKRGQYEITS